MNKNLKKKVRFVIHEGDNEDHHKRDSLKRPLSPIGIHSLENWHNNSHHHHDHNNHNLNHNCDNNTQNLSFIGEKRLSIDNKFIIPLVISSNQENLELIPFKKPYQSIKEAEVSFICKKIMKIL